MPCIVESHELTYLKENILVMQSTTITDQCICYYEEVVNGIILVCAGTEYLKTVITDLTKTIGNQVSIEQSEPRKCSLELYCKYSNFDMTKILYNIFEITSQFSQIVTIPSECCVGTHAENINSVILQNTDNQFAAMSESCFLNVDNFYCTFQPSPNANVLKIVSEQLAFYTEYDKYTDEFKGLIHLFHHVMCKSRSIVVPVVPEELHTVWLQVHDNYVHICDN